MSSELLPCPFCGSAAHFYSAGFVECESCGVRVDDTPAAKAWNARAPMELADSEWYSLWDVLSSARAEFMTHVESANYDDDLLNDFIASAGRQWLAERSGANGQ